MEMGTEPRAGKVTVTGKTHPGIGYKVPEGVQGYSYSLSLTSVLDGGG